MTQNATIYAHASMPAAVVVEYQNEWFIVPRVKSGWDQRTPYKGHHESLRTLDPQEVARIATQIGLAQHGGFRAGAGRTATFAEPMQKATVTLPATYLTYLRALGEGNLSAGIRAAVDRLQEMA